MDNLIEFRFFTKCAPQFFTEELQRSFEKSEESQNLTGFLNTLDTLVTLLSTHHIPLDHIIPTSLSECLKSVESSRKIFHLKVHLILQLELLRAGSNTDTKKLSKIGRLLSVQMALQEDSSAFNRFFVQDLLPRYSKMGVSQHLIEISKELELFEETEAFLKEFEFENLPKKRMMTQNSTDSSIKQSPLRRSPRFVGSQVVYREKKVKPERNLSRNCVKKQISVKSLKRVLNLTPEPAAAQISVHAEGLKEFNQKHFYDKKDGKKIKEAEGIVLVTSTPTKQEHEEYEVTKFKALFND